MQTRELRIGNYVNGVRLGKVKSIFNTHFQVDDIDCISLGNSFQESFKPIPLTQEWAKKFGYGSLAEMAFIISISSLYPIEIASRELEDMSVHQLQNLYFALTGKELTIKE